GANDALEVRVQDRRVVDQGIVVPAACGRVALIPAEQADSLRERDLLAVRALADMHALGAAAGDSSHDAPYDGLHRRGRCPGIGVVAYGGRHEDGGSRASLIHLAVTVVVEAVADLGRRHDLSDTGAERPTVACPCAALARAHVTRSRRTRVA